MKWGLIGLGVGIAAGVAAGILLAPKSGKESLEDIKKKAVSAKDSASTKLRKSDKVVKKSKKSK